jgi:NAD(P)-dependent dehydrogenase (short-subunit alcohol dehydrogenase family)
VSSRVAVVTGAATGIGHAVARHFLDRGLTVVGVGRRASALEEARRSFGAPGERFRCCPLDVRDGERLFSVLSDLPAIDVVVANAGIVRQARLDDADAAEAWRDVLSADLDGVFNTLRAAEPRLVSGGRVVVVSSGLGKRGRAGFGAYAAAKHGVLGLARCLALELAPRQITVNAVCPGWVDTDMARSDLARFAKDQGRGVADVEAEVTRGIPLGRFVAPAEVAHLVGWLASDEAAAVTGQAFDISGGEST